ncbi:ATP-binding protein [Streptomyces albogriseolus]|uniref:ATP-binding protein n=1 Tax=Streptomyces TaxID=1883 RepID=UPI00380A9775
MPDPGPRNASSGSEVTVASNRPFTEWDQTFTDKRLSQAIVDRLTFEAQSHAPDQRHYWCGQARLTGEEAVFHPCTIRREVTGLLCRSAPKGYAGPSSAMCRCGVSGWVSVTACQAVVFSLVEY